MANKQRKKIGLSKTGKCIGSTNEYVSVIKHFESDVPVGKSRNCELPERMFDINKDLTCMSKNQHVAGPKKRIIKFSSASKTVGETSRNIHCIQQLNADLVGTCLPATKASLRKRYPSLPPKFNQAQNPKKEGSNSFTSKSSRELDMNTLTTSYNYMKSPSESNALTTRSSFSVIVDGQVKNKDSHSTNWHSTTKADNYETRTQEIEIAPKRSGTSRCAHACRSKSVLEVSDENALETTKSVKISDQDLQHISKLNEEVKNERAKNKRRHLAELKTEIAEFRNNKGMHSNESVINVKRPNCQIELKLQENTMSATSLEKRDQQSVEMIPSASKLNSEDVNMYDSVAFILQNRVIIPNSDEFGSYPLLPKKPVENKVQQFEPETQQTDVSEADVSDDEASVSGFSAFEQQIG